MRRKEKKNCRKVLFFVLVIVFVFMCVGTIVAKKLGQEGIMALEIIAIGILWMVLTFLLEKILSEKAYQKYKMELPYGLDMYKEYKKYCKIGKKESELKSYNEWKKYIKETYVDRYEKEKKEDFKHFLIKQVRHYEDSYDVIVHIMTPLIIAIAIFILSIDIDISASSASQTIAVAVVSFLLTSLLTSELIDSKTHISFIKDCLEIFDDKQEENIINEEKKLDK